jgi:hypothetical protein
MAAEHDQQLPSRALPHRAPQADPPASLTVASVQPRLGMGSLLANPSINGRGNGPVRAAAMRSLQQTYGNRALQRMLAGQPRPSISRQALPSHPPEVRQSTISEAIPPEPTVEANKHVSESGASLATAPVQRSRSTLIVQRQITDERGNEYNFKKKPPDWFIDLKPADRRKVLAEDARLSDADKTKKYTKVLRKLGIEVQEDSDNDEGGEYTEKKAKRTSKPSGMFNRVYKVPTLKRTGSGLGLITECKEPNCLKRTRELILEDNPVKKKARYHERGYQDKYGESRKPPLCHSEEHPAAWVLAALEEMINNSNGKGHGSVSAYQTTRNYAEAKRTVEWDLPELTPGHTECNASHKDKRWNQLSASKQNGLKQEVFEHLENKGLVSGSWKNPTWT